MLRLRVAVNLGGCLCQPLISRVRAECDLQTNPISHDARAREA